MKKYLIWLRLFAVIVPMLTLLIFVNCYFDPANLFHNVSRSIANSLLDGNATYITSGNMDERLVKKYIIEDMSEQTECLSVGSSVVFGLRAQHAKTDCYYNLGISGADFYDIMAQFGLLELNGKYPSRIILCLDTYFFDDTLSESFTRNMTLKPYAYYMLSILDGQTPASPKNDTRATTRQKIQQMFSVTYFQSSIDYIKANGTLNIPRWGIADVAHTGTYYHPDGSMVYAASYQNSTAANVAQDAATYDVDYHFSAYDHISPSKSAYFEKLLVHLTNHGTEVELFLSPMCPSLWERCNRDTHPILWEVEEFAQEMADKYRLKLMGSYNPHTFELNNQAFYDARHLRHDYLEIWF